MVALYKTQLSYATLQRAGRDTGRARRGPGATRAGSDAGRSNAANHRAKRKRELLLPLALIWEATK